MASDAAGILDERRRRVETELTAAAGDASLCSISRSAGSVPGVKYLEGRMAALREIERARRAGQDLATTAAATLGRWTGRLEDSHTRNMGPDWVAYHAGGVDELDELVAALAEPAPPTG